MAAIHSMTDKQLFMMRDIALKAKSFRITVDCDTTEIDSITNFIIWDDDNRVVYCIDENAALATQYIAPFRVRSFSYNDIEAIISYY